MASIYKRADTWWIKYYLKGVPVYQSLKTNNKRVALDRKRQLEYQIATGGLVRPSETPLPGFLEDFCRYLKGARTPKGYKNDISYLRTFFGAACHSLVPGSMCNTRKQPRKKRTKIRDRLRGRSGQLPRINLTVQ